MSRSPALNVLQALTASRWAMRREALELMLAIADRDLDGILAAGVRAGQQSDIVDPADEDDRIRRRRALFTAPATEYARSPRVGVRDGVAIVPIVGPLCRYASWIQEICGMTSYQLAAMDLQTVLDDPAIRAVMVHLDTPGGEVNGCAELAELLYAARGRKRLVAMVSDGAASAGYWIAAACDEIVVSPAAYVGSIGVWFEIMDYGEMEREAGIKRFRIVSSQSPNKVPDPADERGRSVLQREADQFADAFLEAVARYRSCSVDEVIARGDAGAVFIGRHAVAQRLADRVSTSEALLAELAGQTPVPAAGAPPATAVHSTENPMPTPTTPAAARAPRALQPGDEITCKVTREVRFTEGASATVAEIRENATVIAIKEGEEEKRWLLAEEVEGGAATAPTDDADEDDIADEPAAVTQAYPKATGAITAAAATAERERILGILSLPGSAAHADVVRACIADPTCTRASAAEQLLAARPTAPTVGKQLAAFFAAESEHAAPAPSGPAPATGDDARAQEILAARALVRGQ